MSKDDWPKEKRWKDVYTRSAKLDRAAQLGMDYPRKGDAQTIAQAEIEQACNVLFVCSRNQWRSPTAEQVFKKHAKLAVRSGGTSAQARRKVSADDVAWADVIFVMEEKHRTRLAAEFARLLQHKILYVLDIPDEYRLMDPNLISELERSVLPILAARRA
jgi:predicted protein tyrosine phosphatase